MRFNTVPTAFHTTTTRVCMALVICNVLGCAAGNGAAGADKPPAKPATVAEAEEKIDLSNFIRLKDSEPPQCSRVASLSYEATSSVKSAFEFQQKQLLKQNWKELPSSFISDQAASAAFARNGFTVSVTVSPMSKPGTVLVAIANHGNIDLKTLPVPADAKPLYAFPVSAAYISEMPVEKAADESRKLLLAKGWRPYGKAGDSLFFKQNGVRLLAYITAAPAQGGKTMITYSTEQLSLDLPAPEETKDLRYVDQTKTLSFDSSEPQDQIFSFYRDKLAETGWQATTEKPVQIDWKNLMIFRNPAKDMLTLETYTIDNLLRVKLVHQSAAEIAAIEKAIEEQKKKKKAG